MVIVTGANGFIGSAFVWQLNEEGETKILCVDSVNLQERPSPLRKRSFSQFQKHDEFLKNLPGIDAKKISCIVHMGACSSTTELNEEFLRENNTLYTQKLWQWCTENQIPFIYASSGAIYGDGCKGFDDRTPPAEFKALNPYGESKLAFDRWAVQQTATPPKWYGLRFFNVFGPNEDHKGDMSSVVYKAYRQIRSKGEIQLFRSHNPDFKDGEQKRDFVYVKDIVRWISELRRQLPASGIYNMGFGTARTWIDLARATFVSLDARLEIDWIDIPDAMRPRYQYFTEAKMDKLRSAGLTSPQWNLERGIDDYVRHYLQQGDGL